MRLALGLTAIAAVVTALLIGGCGSKTPTGKPAVSLSILAPTSGSTLGVRDITVAGTVSPATASVLVAGQPAQVVNGSYHHQLRLAGDSQTITITAAGGRLPARQRDHDRPLQP